VLGLTRGLTKEIAALQHQITVMRPAREPDLTGCADWLDRLDALQVPSWSCLPVGSALASAYFGDLVKKLTKKVGPRAPELANALHIGLGGNQTAEIGVYVRAEAARLREHPDLDLERDPGFRAAIERFGHRAAAELELANPSWRQNPAPLAEAIRREARRPAGVDGAEARAEAEREFGAIATRGLRAALARSRRMMPQRENAKLPICRLFDECRRLLEVAAPLLREHGVVAEPDQVHMLRHAELHGVLRGAEGPGPAALARRAAAHARCLELELPELIEAGPDGVRPVGTAFFTERGLIPDAEADASATELTGTPASPGVVSGTARVLRDPAAEFEPGEILFASSVDPGWTPILVCAGAIVLDTGGEMSHGATVARELGIPCVVNVKHGMSVIPDGGRVEVDGGTGIVRVLTGVAT
jgi:pyruvate,water dikinase